MELFSAVSFSHSSESLCSSSLNVRFSLLNVSTLCWSSSHSAWQEQEIRTNLRNCIAIQNLYVYFIYIYIYMSSSLGTNKHDTRMYRIEIFPSNIYINPSIAKIILIPLPSNYKASLLWACLSAYLNIENNCLVSGNILRYCKKH